MNRNIGTALVVLVVALVVASMSVFTVDQRQNVIVARLGEIVSVKDKPGIYLKLPLVDRVRVFDTRILTIDTDDPDLFLTSEKKNVLVDSFVKWRIIDVKQYYVSVQGDEERARIRLTQTVNDSLRAEFGKRTIHDVVSGERDDIMNVMREKVDSDARKIGVQVLDVRLKRVDLPQEVSESVYRRMEAERKRVANELRSTGAAEGEKIRADADKQREITIANAYREAQKIKGEGDADAARTFAESFGKDAQFAQFYRSLDAYKASFNKKSDVMVVDPSSDFFKAMRGSGNSAAAPAKK